MQPTQLPHFISGLRGCRMDSHQHQQHLFVLRPPGTVQRPSTPAGTEAFLRCTTSTCRNGSVSSRTLCVCVCVSQKWLFWERWSRLNPWVTECRTSLGLHMLMSCFCQKWWGCVFFSVKYQLGVRRPVWGHQCSQLLCKVRIRLFFGCCNHHLTHTRLLI